MMGNYLSIGYNTQLDASNFLDYVNDFDPSIFALTTSSVYVLHKENNLGRIAIKVFCKWVRGVW